VKIRWTQLDGVGADRLWLQPLGLISGRAAGRTVAGGDARPLTDSNLAFTLVEVLGLGPDRRPVSVTAPIAEFE